jgi:hypothetical protein
MTVVRRRHDDGRVTRELVCSACSDRKPYGVCCPAPGCGHYLFKTVTTRHRGSGSTVRVKACRKCGHRIRVREQIESVRA